MMPLCRLFWVMRIVPPTAKKRAKTDARVSVAMQIAISTEVIIILDVALFVEKKLNAATVASM